MDNILDQGSIIELTANEVLSLEQQALELDRRSAEVKDRAERSRMVLFDLINEVQDTIPESPLPGLFTVNGILIDITGGNSYIGIRKAPDPNLLFEPTS